MSDMYVHGNDVEGKPLQEDVITREAASKSVHVLGQGNPSSLMLQYTANLHVIMPCVICNLEGAAVTQPTITPHAPCMCIDQSLGLCLHLHTILSVTC